MPVSSAGPMLARVGGLSRSFTDVKVFSATEPAQRENLHECVATWLAAHVDHELVDAIVKRSCDAGSECLTFVLFLRRRT